MSSSSGRIPFPPSTTNLVDDADIAALKARILDSGLSVSRLVGDRVGLGVHVPR